MVVQLSSLTPPSCNQLRAFPCREASGPILVRDGLKRDNRDVEAGASVKHAAEATAPPLEAKSR
jgi:hypothetical protein